jgi:hypothetical protein
LCSALRDDALQHLQGGEIRNLAGTLNRQQAALAQTSGGENRNLAGTLNLLAC